MKSRGRTFSFRCCKSLFQRKRALHSRTIRIGRGPVGTGGYSFPRNVVCNQKYNVFTFIPLVCLCFYWSLINISYVFRCFSNSSNSFWTYIFCWWRAVSSFRRFKSVRRSPIGGHLWVWFVLVINVKVLNELLENLRNFLGRILFSI